MLNVMKFIRIKLVTWNMKFFLLVREEGRERVLLHHEAGSASAWNQGCWVCIYSAKVRRYPLTASCADTPRVRRPLPRYAHAVHSVNGLVSIGSIYQFNVFQYIYIRCVL